MEQELGIRCSLFINNQAIALFRIIIGQFLIHPIKYKSLVEMGANNSTPTTPSAPPTTPVTRETSPATSPSASANARANRNAIARARANQIAERAMAAARANEHRNMASDEQWEAFIASHRDLEEGIRRIKRAIEQDDAHSHTRGTSPNEAEKKAFYNASEPIQRELVNAFMAVYSQVKDPAIKSAFVALVPDWVPKLAKIYGKNLSGGKRKSKQQKQRKQRKERKQRTRSKNRK
jgi:hypothetical protein